MVCAVEKPVIIGLLDFRKCVDKPLRLKPPHCKNTGHLKQKHKRLVITVNKSSQEAFDWKK